MSAIAATIAPATTTNTAMPKKASATSSVPTTCRHQAFSGFLARWS
ncbi:hypothetical protein [Nonomuraea dietziae]